jgi:TonB family protein
MLSANEENKIFKIFLYASVASLALHTGIFFFVIQIGKHWGWIPIDESLFEVSIVSLMEKPVGNRADDHPSGRNIDTAMKKSAQKTSKPVKSKHDPALEKKPETNLPAPDANHLPGDSPPAETMRAEMSDAPVSAGSGMADVGAENSGYGGGEFKPPGVEDGSGGFGSKSNYLDMVRFKIENQKKYPYSAQQRQIQGQVTVEFEISLDGKITEPSVSKSSGYPSLDTAAIDAVKKASPFASPPRRFFNDAIHINLPIRFELVR